WCSTLARLPAVLRLAWVTHTMRTGFFGSTSIPVDVLLWWHPGLMGLLLVRLIELLIVIVPVIGVVIAGVKALSVARTRQADRGDVPDAAAPHATGNTAAQWRAVSRTVKEHDRTDTRWLDY